LRGRRAARNADRPEQQRAHRPEGEHDAQLLGGGGEGGHGDRHPGREQPERQQPQRQGEPAGDARCHPRVLLPSARSGADTV